MAKTSISYVINPMTLTDLFVFVLIYCENSGICTFHNSLHFFHVWYFFNICKNLFVTTSQTNGNVFVYLGLKDNDQLLICGLARLIFKGSFFLCFWKHNIPTITKNNRRYTLTIELKYERDGKYRPIIPASHLYLQKKSGAGQQMSPKRPFILSRVDLK